MAEIFPDLAKISLMIQEADQRQKRINPKNLEGNQRNNDSNDSLPFIRNYEDQKKVA